MQSILINMSIKRIVAFFLIISATLGLQAQIGVGPIEIVKSKAGEFDMYAMKKLEKSKTVFIYRPGDDLDELKAAIEDVWTFTEISFEPYSKLKNMNLDGISVFSLGGVNTKVTNTGSGMSYDNTHIYLNLWMMGKNKKGKPEKKSFCRIDFHPSGDFYGKMPKAESEDALDFVYNKAILRNWYSGFLRNQLQVVNGYLSKGSERWLYKNEEKNGEVRKLATNTLYVIDYAMMDFNKYNGDESKKLDETKTFKSYPYKYELIDAKELSDKILNSSEPFYYLAYVRSSTDKYITVYNSVTGSIVYTKYSPVSYTVKSDDLKDLAKAIK